MERTGKRNNRPPDRRPAHTEGARMQMHPGPFFVFYSEVSTVRSPSAEARML